MLARYAPPAARPRCLERPHARSVACCALASRQTLPSWLLAQERAGHADGELVILIDAIASACRCVASLVARASLSGNTGLASGANASGDEQKKLDVLANNVFVAAVRDCGRCSILVSEEEDEPIGLVSSSNYIACFDPIDGSSNLDAAIATGSIFGVYAAAEDCVIEADDTAASSLDKCVIDVRRSGHDLVAAGYCMFSSSTVLVLTLRTGVWGFTLDRDIGEFVVSHPNMKIPDPGARIVSGNAGNVDKWQPKALGAFFRSLQDSHPPWSYRYVGALVADFHRTLCYGGLWLYPPDAGSPSGKARLLYEVAPMALLAEEAGGMATCGADAARRVLDVVPASPHQRSPMFVGGAGDVRALQAFLAAAA